MAKTSKVLLSLILWNFPSLLWASEVNSGAVLIDSKTGKQVCNAIHIKPQEVVAPLHCLSTLDPNDILVRTFPRTADVKVTRIRSIVDREGFFPSFDIAVLQLEKPWSDFKPLNIENESIPAKGSYFLETLRPGQSKKIRIKLSGISNLQGPRITPLVSMGVSGVEVPCYGDSGAPVFRENRQSRILVGFLTGLAAPLTTSSYDCKDPVRLITPLAPFRNWIEGGPIPFQKKPKSSSYASIQDACRDQAFTSPGWVAIQELILSMKPSAQDLLGCEGLNRRWEESMNRRDRVKFSEVLDPQGFSFLKSANNAEFQAVTQDDIKILQRWIGLESLTINGTTPNIDLAVLGSLPHIRKFRILHSSGFTGLKDIAGQWKHLESLELFNALPAYPSELKSIEKTLPNLKITIDQMSKAR